MLWDQASKQRFAEGSGRQRRAWFDFVVLLVLVAWLSGHSALGYASPPDPLWLPGIYDGGDYDDEIALLTDAIAIVVLPGVVVALLCPLVKFAPLNVGSVPTDVSLLGLHLRSPPID